MDRHRRFIPAAAWLIAACLLASTGAAAKPKPKDWNPPLGSFVTVVDNPYFPLPPGRTLVYRGSSKDGIETMEFEVTSRTRTVMGILAIVVIERSTVNGQLVEVSENWFAQDDEGAVWYFGEATQTYLNGVPGSTEGSWEAGVAGAKPGIIMEADPQVGDSYFQEFAEGVAQDMAQVMSTARTETVPQGSYSGVLQTKEWSPIEPSSVEHKSYARGLGLILEEKGRERLELVEVRG